MFYFFFFSSRRRHTRLQGDWSSDVCSSDLHRVQGTSLRPPHSTHLGIPGILLPRAGISNTADIRIVLPLDPSGGGSAGMVIESPPCAGIPSGGLRRRPPPSKTKHTARP